jgi:hypothetical protein
MPASAASCFTCRACFATPASSTAPATVPILPPAASDAILNRRGMSYDLRPMTITDIVTSIDRRIVEIHAEVQNLEAARTALANGSQPAEAATPRRARRKPARAVYQVVPVGKLTAMLAGSEGLRTRELATATNGDPAQVLELLKEQESAGEVRRTGTRAATRWHVITDEDRIAARAAELQSRSRRKPARKS